MACHSSKVVAAATMVMLRQNMTMLHHLIQQRTTSDLMWPQNSGCDIRSPRAHSVCSYRFPRAIYFGLLIHVGVEECFSCSATPREQDLSLLNIFGTSTYNHNVWPTVTEFCQVTSVWYMHCSINNVWSGDTGTITRSRNSSSDTYHRKRTVHLLSSLSAVRRLLAHK